MHGDSFLIQDIAKVQSVDALISEFYLQKRHILCFNRITNPDSLNGLFGEMSKIQVDAQHQ